MTAGYGVDVWRCLRSIMDECDGYRFGQDSYDPKFDHIYEMASSALSYMECPMYREHGACCCSTGVLGNGCALAALALPPIDGSGTP